MEKVIHLVSCILFASVARADQPLVYSGAVRLPLKSPGNAKSHPFLAAPQFGGDGGGGSGACGKVLVDCGTHEISYTLNGRPVKSPIDCGKSGLTHNGVGRVGRVINTTNVGQAVDIDIPNMGAPPRGKGEVFHLTPPVSSGAGPRKANNSLGCIHVASSVLNNLAECAGSALEIRNAAGGSGPGGSTSGGAAATAAAAGR